MNFKDRLKFYILGFIAGIFLVVLFFGDRNSCSNYLGNYLPNGRVLQEVNAKPIIYENFAMKQLADLKLDTAYINQNILKNGKIDFDKSDQRQKPCGEYIILHKDYTANLEMKFLKCDSLTKIVDIKSLN